MIWKNSLDRLQRHFCDQFEPEGAGFLYRRNCRGVPIRVSAQERDDFVAAFRKRVRLGMWVGLAMVLVWIVGAMALGIDDDSVQGGLVDWVGGGLIVAVAALTFHLAWRAPSTVLARRAPVGRALDRAEARNLMLSKLGYRQLALGFVLAALLGMWLFGERYRWDGWGHLLLLLPAMVIGLTIINMSQKWRLERERKPHHSA